jgi:hypothetical protein
MKVLIIGLGLVFGSMGIFMAQVSFGHANEKVLDAQRLEAQILDLKQKILLLKKLHQQPAAALDATYVFFMNDMGLIARAHRAVFTVSLQEGNDGDVGKSARPSAFSGLRELHLHGVFSGFAHRTMLLSLLDALSGFEEGTPVLFQRIDQEKDALTFDLVVVGL